MDGIYQLFSCGTFAFDEEGRIKPEDSARGQQSGRLNIVINENFPHKLRFVGMRGNTPTIGYLLVQKLLNGADCLDLITASRVK